MTKLAFDRSMRKLDKDGRLHIDAGNPISKATVSPYLGGEIPDGEDLGLDPDKVYYLLRDPDELAKAAATFNNLPLLSKHVPVNADAPMQDLVVGSTGTDASFDDPYLTNSLVVWVGDSIDLIEADYQKELSAAYYYTADMTPGNYGGLQYDGVMRNIVGNHVALVKEGRAGRDVVVGDSQNLRITGMLKSRKALMVCGAVMALVGPKLAQDTQIDTDKVFGDVNRANYKSKKTDIVARIQAATFGKLAQDADLEDVVKLLDTLEKIDDAGDGDGDMDDLPAPAVDADEGDSMSKVLAYLKGKLTDEQLAEVSQLAGGGDMASDEDDKDDDFPPKKDDNDSKIAEDAAVKRAVAEVHAIARAKEDVAPYIGKIAQDAGLNAAAIYKMALDANNINTNGVHSSAFAAMLALVPKPGAQAAGNKIAQDAPSISDVASRFPGVKALIPS